MWQQDSNPGERIAEEACSSGGFEFNDLQKFWNSLLGIATMGTNLVFAFLTTILAVSFTITGARQSVGLTGARESDRLAGARELPSCF